MEKEVKTGKPLNEGHRNRIRKRLLDSPETIQDHELVEILLFNTLKRTNTNPVAHRLLNKGRSLKGILELDKRQLTDIEGVGENVAAFIKTLSEFVKRCEKEDAEQNKDKVITKRNVSAKIHEKIPSYNKEHILLITTDSGYKILGEHIVSKGSSDEASVPIKEIVRLAVLDKAKYAILAHNHPDNSLVASFEDVETTKLVSKALSFVDVLLIEHFIVSENAEVGIIGRFVNE